jgi:AGCS family alanine or glycine:cation symporter
MGGVNVGGVVVSISLLLFAFTTAIAWSYYGDRAVGYLFGTRWVAPYRWVYVLFVFIGAVWSQQLVWKFVDTVITIMAIPNLVALMILSPSVLQMTREYFAVEHPRLR